MNSTLIKKLKIIEFASVLAGPLAGNFFSELGAKVIKIENPKTDGDITRSWRTPSEGGDSSISAYYASANYGKESVFLDLTNEEDHKKALEICVDADVVISNFKPSSAKKLGITFSALKNLNPSLIFAQLSAYPEGKEAPAFDVLLQAQSGYLSMTGFQDKKYAKIPVAMIDMLAAHQLREGILLALLEREIDGKGRKVSTNLYAAALSGLINQASAYLMNGDLPQPLGSAHPQIAPYGDLFYTKDKVPLILAIGTDRKFYSLLQLLGLEKYKDKFATNQDRVNQREELRQILANSINAISAENITQMLDSESIPYSKINNLKNVFDHKEASDYLIDEMREGRKCIKTKSVVFDIQQSN
jgi:crotonobetainyl-CoA:carnitine CoA-transferase CaiB-like acyl-CoA transferase